MTRRNSILALVMLCCLIKVWSSISSKECICRKWFWILVPINLPITKNILGYPVYITWRIWYLIPCQSGHSSQNSYWQNLISGYWLRKRRNRSKKLRDSWGTSRGSDQHSSEDVLIQLRISFSITHTSRTIFLFLIKGKFQSLIRLQIKHNSNLKYNYLQIKLFL